MLLISLLVFDFIPLSHLCTDCLSSKRRDSSCPPLSIFIPALYTAGLSHKEQVGSSSLTSGHYRCHTRSERGLEPTWTGTESSSKTLRITVSAFTRSPRRSLAVIILFALSPSSPPKRGAGEWKRRRNSLLDLNLLSSEFWRDDRQPWR